MSLEPLDERTVDTRRVFAECLDEQIQLQRSAVKAGHMRVGEDLLLPAAVERYFKAHPSLAPSTKESYAAAIASLVSGREHLTTQRITPATLAIWRADVANARRRNVKRSGKRGERVESDGRRSPHTVNTTLRRVGAFLEWARASGMLRLNSDDICDLLFKEKAPLKRRGFLSTDDIHTVLAACERHDSARHKLTRDEKAGRAEPGSTPRYVAIAPFIRFLLLSGMRVSEALALDWKHVDGDMIRVPAEITKDRRARDIDLTVSPSALPALSGEGRIFAPLTNNLVDMTVKRLVRDFGAPRFSPHACRRTCGTYLTCAPSIYGGASAYLSARRLGHSVAIAERHYVGAARVPASAKTLEQAMGIEKPRATAPTVHGVVSDNNDEEETSAT